MENDFGKGMTVYVKDPSDRESILRAFRKLKKRAQDEGIFHELRERQHFIKPSVRRNRAKASARKRWLRTVDKMKQDGKWVG